MGGCGGLRGGWRGGFPVAPVGLPGPGHRAQAPIGDEGLWGASTRTVTHHGDKVLCMLHPLASGIGCCTCCAQAFLKWLGSLLKLSRNTKCSPYLFLARMIECGMQLFPGSRLNDPQLVLGRDAVLLCGPCIHPHELPCFMGSYVLCLVQSSLV